MLFYIQDVGAFYSPENSVFLQGYLKIYPPKGFLFEGMYGGRYSEGSVQNVFTDAKIQSGITPAATLHTLRYGFAIHLKEALPCLIDSSF